MVILFAKKSLFIINLQQKSEDLGINSIWNSSGKLQIQLSLVQNTAEIAEITLIRDEEKLATKFFERWENLHLFSQEFYHGK